MITSREIELIVSSWHTVRPVSAQFAELFYYRLFEEAPQVRDMFKGSMFSQQQKFVKMIDDVVTHITRLEPTTEKTEPAAQNDAGCGVDGAQFTLVEKVLMDTFARAMQGTWTDELQQAWTKACNGMADCIPDRFQPLYNTQD